MNYYKPEKKEQYRKIFFDLKSGKQLADLMGTSVEFLMKSAYSIPQYERYNTFTIPKKSGGFRLISSPHPKLKIIQDRLNELLQLVYDPPEAAHGFIENKSIVTNSLAHAGKKYVLNIDIKDFFPSINFGRVRGLLMNKTYNLHPIVATIIAQICCHDNILPQGAPTSPVISNMICKSLDNILSIHAEQYNCSYSRYADDITFSSDRKFSKGFMIRLRKIIKFNGFELNEKKLRIQSGIQHQEVTGLVVNQFVNVKRSYIRKVRSILHCWETKGLKYADKLYAEKYNRHRVYGTPNFVNSVNGMLQFKKW